MNILYTTTARCLLLSLFCTVTTALAGSMSADGRRRLTAWDDPYWGGPAWKCRRILVQLSSPHFIDRAQGSEALFRAGRDLSVEMLSLCRKGDYGLPSPVLRYLVRYGGNSGVGFVHMVLKDWKREDEVSARAAEALGTKRYTPALPDLLTALAAPSWRLRAAAAKAMGYFGKDRHRLAFLRRRFRLEKDERVIPELALALYRCGDGRGLGYLVSVFRNLPPCSPLSENVRSVLYRVAQEWPRYEKIQCLDPPSRDRLLENWIYEWEHGLLPSRASLLSRAAQH